MIRVVRIAKQHTELKNFLASFPRWTCSIVCLIIIIWVMDAPTPFMETLTDRLVSVDKVFHVLIGAALVFSLAFDWQRRHKWQLLTAAPLTVMALVALALTSITEFVQALTPEIYRRWFEWADIAAQAAGAAGMGVLYSFLQLLWCKRPEKDNTPI